MLTSFLWEEIRWLIRVIIDDGIGLSKNFPHFPPALNLVCPSPPGDVGDHPTIITVARRRPFSRWCYLARSPLLQCLRTGWLGISRSLRFGSSILENG